MATPNQTTSKTLEYYLALSYPILLIYDHEDEAWFARIPILQGCMSDGESPAEALENLKEAQTSWLLSSLKHSDPIPEPEAAEKYLLEHGDIRLLFNKTD